MVLSIRVSHSYGKSFRDIVRALEGRFENPPDIVAYPTTENEILDLLQFAAAHNIAVVPYGGGTSVVGGVEPPLLEGTYMKAVLSIDMKHFDKLLAFDRVPLRSLDFHNF